MFGSRNWRKPLAILFLALSLLAGLLFRLTDISRSLWLDELHTSWTVQQGPTEVISRAADGNQTPLYFLAVWVITSVLGESELTLRIFSVLCGLGLTVLISLITWRWTRSWGATLMVSLIAAADPYWIEYSQEARVYSALMLVSTMQIFFFVEACWPGGDLRAAGDSRGQIPDELSQPGWLGISWTRWGLILTATVGCYVHLTSVLLTGSIYLYWFVLDLNRKSPWRSKDWNRLLDPVLIGFCCLPLIALIDQVSDRRSNWELFVTDAQWSPALRFQGWMYLGPGMLLVVLSAMRKQYRNRKALLIPASLVALYLLPILIAWILFKTGAAPLYHQRYFLSGWPAIVLFWSVAIGRIRVFSRMMNGLILLLVIGWCSWTLASDNHLGLFWLRGGTSPFDSGWKRAVDELNGRCDTSDLVILFSNLIEDSRLNDPELSEVSRRRLARYCLFPLNGIYRAATDQQIPGPTLIRPRFQLEDIQPMVESRRVFLVIRGNGPITSDILNEFAEFGIRNRLFIRQVSQRVCEIKGGEGHFIGVFGFDVEREELPASLEKPEN